MKTLSINASTNELLIYGQIGADAISAKAVAEHLAGLDKTKTVSVRIASSGGDVFEGIAIYNMLKDLQSVETYIDGLAASMGSVIAMAGDKIYMAENAFLMIHNPWASIAGDSSALRDMADTLEKIQPTLVGAYAKRSGKTDDDIISLMKRETWLNAQDALAEGFIDEISEHASIAASVNLDRFNKVPAELHNAIESEQHRTAEIKNIAELVGVSPDKYIKAGLDIEQAREQIMQELGKDERPISGQFIMNDTDQIKNFLEEAPTALLLRNGIKPKDVTPGAEYLAKFNPVSLAEKFLGLHGVSVAMMGRQEILNKAFDIRSQHSTSDFAELLGNTAGKSLRMAYNEEIGSHEAWTGSTEVQDFQERSLIQLSEAPDLDLVHEGGEYKHGSFGDNAEKFQIAKYGKLFSITYEALVNDDLAAFTRLPMAFGKSAKRKECDLVYNVLTTNPTLADGVALFHSNHNNVVPGASGLDITSLTSARLLMRKQTGVNSTAPINVVPKFLIVPAALETDAEQLLASLVDPTKSNDTPNHEFVRALQLIVDPRLDGDSETTWYLAAEPTQIDTVTRAYLAGAPRPFYETKDGWEIDGMSVKARLEVAAVPVDHRGLVRVTV